MVGEVSPSSAVRSLRTGAKDSKKKLNMSFENAFSYRKKDLQGKSFKGKPLSSSPRRTKGQSKSPHGMAGVQPSIQGKKKSGGAGDKGGLYSIRDINFFIKKMEKDLSEKFS